MVAAVQGVVALVSLYELTDDELDSVLFRLHWDPDGEPSRVALGIAAKLESQRTVGGMVAVSKGYLYVARVERDEATGLVTLTAGRDQDVFEVHDGDEFITFVTPAPLFGEED